MSAGASGLPVAPGDLGPIPYLRPAAGPALFRRRAERLAALAPGHAAGDFLLFLSRVCAAQHEAAGRLRLSPNGRDLPPGRPLDVAAPPPPEWREALAHLVGALRAAPMPPEARQVLDGLAGAAPGALDPLAARLLSGELRTADVAAAPFVGAALQVAYAGLASALPREAVARAEDPACPTCGFAPAVGVILGDDRLRYLSCALCASEWHVTRLNCAVCLRQDDVGYLEIEGAGGAAKAETCGRCKVYTKILHVERAPALEPLADDLATLALDLLVAERGFARNGRNLFLATAAA